MRIETERLIVRDVCANDAEALLKIKYDPQVLRFCPDLICDDATLEDVRRTIEYFENERAPKDFSREVFYGVELKENGELIGVITVSFLGCLRELQMGWMVRREYAGRGYASEAAKAASDALLLELNLPFMAVVMDEDNPASFRTAQKSGFKLFEKRVPFDYHYSRCNPEDPEAVAAVFAKNQAKIGSAYYYFRKYHPADCGEQYYGDVAYTGRFA